MKNIAVMHMGKKIGIVKIDPEHKEVLKLFKLTLEEGNVNAIYVESADNAVTITNDVAEEISNIIGDKMEEVDVIDMGKKIGTIMLDPKHKEILRLFNLTIPEYDDNIVRVSKDVAEQLNNVIYNRGDKMDERLKNGTIVKNNRTGEEFKIVNSILMDDEYLYKSEKQSGEGFWLRRCEFTLGNINKLKEDKKMEERIENGTVVKNKVIGIFKGLELKIATAIELNNERGVYWYHFEDPPYPGYGLYRTEFEIISLPKVESIEERIENGTVVIDKKTGMEIIIVNSISMNEGYLYKFENQSGEGFWLCRYQFTIEKKKLCMEERLENGTIIKEIETGIERKINNSIRLQNADGSLCIYLYQFENQPYPGFGLYKHEFIVLFQTKLKM